MNEMTKKIENEKLIFSKWGYITYQYNKNLFFKIAKLTYEMFDNEQFQYIFEPFYDVLEIIKVDIPGIDLTLKQKYYHRVNLTPVFISERITPKNRVNLRDELKQQNMDYYQPFMLALDSKRVYGGDNLSLKSESFYDENVPLYYSQKDLFKDIPLTIKNLAARRNFVLNQIEVTDQNRMYFLNIYLHLYQKISQYYTDKKKKHVGREKKTISNELLLEIRDQYAYGVITIEEAIDRSKLGSKSTFYRRLQELENKNNDK